MMRTILQPVLTLLLCSLRSRTRDRIFSFCCAAPARGTWRRDVGEQKNGAPASAGWPWPAEAGAPQLPSRCPSKRQIRSATDAYVRIYVITQSGITKTDGESMRIVSRRRIGANGSAL